MKYFLPNGVYDVLKWVGLICLPALGVFYQNIGPVWGLPYVDQIVTTLNALGLLIGVLIGASAITAKAPDDAPTAPIDMATESESAAMEDDLKGV